MSDRIVDDFQVNLAANRVHDLRLIRLNELPGTPEVRYRVTASITTQATLGVSPSNPKGISVIAKLGLEARFSEETSQGIEGKPFAEVQISIDGLLLTSLQTSELEDDPRIGPNAMHAITQSLVAMADVYVRQVLSMAALPFAIPPEKLQEIARQQVTAPVAA